MEPKSIRRMLLEMFPEAERVSLHSCWLSIRFQGYRIETWWNTDGSYDECLMCHVQPPHGPMRDVEAHLAMIIKAKAQMELIDRTFKDVNHDPEEAGGDVPRC